LLIVAAFVLNYIDEWHKVWIVSFIATAAFIALPGAWALLPLSVTEPIEKGARRFFSRLAFWRKPAASGVDRNNSQLAAASRSSSYEQVKK
jgi:hypothetical protein